MSSVIDLRTYVSASNSRLLVMVDLQAHNHDEFAKDHAPDLTRALANCAAAIAHARNLRMPIAFTRQADGPGSIERPVQSAWISGFEPKRSDMVFERRQPSCYANQLFEAVVSQIGSFTIAGLAQEACLATAIDASHRGHHATFLSDASLSRGRRDSDARDVHILTTKAIQLFADTFATRDWLVATSSRIPKWRQYG